MTEPEERNNLVKYESGSEGKLSALHQALSHDGPASSCVSPACRRIRLEADSGVVFGREDKLHPAGRREL